MAATASGGCTPVAAQLQQNHIVSKGCESDNCALDLLDGAYNIIQCVVVFCLSHYTSSHGKSNNRSSFLQRKKRAPRGTIA